MLTEMSRWIGAALGCLKHVSRDAGTNSKAHFRDSEAGDHQDRDPGRSSRRDRHGNGPPLPYAKRSPVALSLAALEDPDRKKAGTSIARSDRRWRGQPGTAKANGYGHPWPQASNLCVLWQLNRTCFECTNWASYSTTTGLRCCWGSASAPFSV